MLVFLIRGGNLYKAFHPSCLLSHCRMWPYIGAHRVLMIGMSIQEDTTSAPPSAFRAPGSYNSLQSHHSEGTVSWHEKATNVTSTSSIPKCYAFWNPHVEVNHGSLDKSVMVKKRWYVAHAPDALECQVLNPLVSATSSPHLGTYCLSV